MRRYILENEYSSYNTFFYEEKIGVDSAREIRQLVLTTPTGGEKRVIALLGELTIEAQNALLKAIEELRDDTTLFIHAHAKDVLLPTVLSRCQMFEVREELEDLTFFPLHHSLNQHTTTFGFVQSVFDKGDLEDKETIEMIEYSIGQIFKNELDPEILRKAAKLLTKLYEYKQLILINNVQLRIGLEKILASN